MQQDTRIRGCRGKAAGHGMGTDKTGKAADISTLRPRPRQERMTYKERLAPGRQAVVPSTFVTPISCVKECGYRGESHAENGWTGSVMPGVAPVHMPQRHVEDQ